MPTIGTVAEHPDFGLSTDVEVYYGHNNRAFVSGHWTDPLHGYRVYANLPADEVAVGVASPDTIARVSR